MQETMPGARRQGRPRTARIDNIKTWTGLPVEESIRMTEDTDKCRKWVQPADQGWLKNWTEQNSGVKFVKKHGTFLCATVYVGVTGGRYWCCVLRDCHHSIVCMFHSHDDRILHSQEQRGSPSQAISQGNGLRP